MFITRLAIIGLIILVTPTLSSERRSRPLPSTPLPAEIVSKSSMGIQFLKDSSNFMIKEFEDACKANISTINSFPIDPIKPEGFGAQIQYYTQSDKIELIDNLNRLLKVTTDSVNTKLEVLDKEEAAKNLPLSNQDILKSFRELYGILNDGRKQCAFSLNQIEKQVLRTKTLKKKCSSSLKKGPSDLQKAKTSVSRNIKKYLPGLRGQKKDQQDESPDTSEREAPTTSPKAKKILGTKETREEERQRLLLEALEKSGIR